MVFLVVEDTLSGFPIVLFELADIAPTDLASYSASNSGDNGLIEKRVEKSPAWVGVGVEAGVGVAGV